MLFRTVSKWKNLYDRRVKTEFKIRRLTDVVWKKKAERG